MPKTIDKAAALTRGSVPHRPVAFAAITTAVSGFLDAIGYAELSHLYVSFMSGNSTHLGMALAKGQWPDGLAAFTIVLVFIAGASIGTWVADRSPQRALLVIIGYEIILVTAAIGLADAGRPRASMTVIAFMMGMQNTVHQIVRGTDLGRGFLSGTLFSFGQAVARMAGDRMERQRALDTATSWLAFIAGVVAGTLALADIGLVPSLGMVLIILAASMLTIRKGLL